MTLLELITQAIVTTDDRHHLRRLNRAWWREYFRDRSQYFYTEEPNSSDKPQLTQKGMPMKTDATNPEVQRITKLLHDRQKLSNADLDTAANFTGEADPQVCSMYGVAAHTSWDDLIKTVRNQQAGRSAGAGPE